MIRCDTPATLREELQEACYAVTSPNQRETRAKLDGQPGVVAVEPAGAVLHLFLDEKNGSVEELKKRTPFEAKRISPSLEDVFIALVRREEMAHAA
jgi:hypothetical protein